MVDCRLKNTTVSPQRIYYVEENLHKLYIKWKMNSYVVMSVCKSVIKPLRWYSFFQTKKFQSVSILEAKQCFEINFTHLFLG